MSDEATVRNGRILPGEKLLQFDTPDTFPDAQRLLANRLCREMKTCGDGACAVHAAFGHADPAMPEVKLANARAFLAAQLPQTLA